jgi:hypothetical protein
MGGFMGYRAIMGRLQPWLPNLKPLELKDMSVIPNVPYPGDLANMMGIEHRILDSYSDLVPKNGFTWKLASYPPPHDPNDPVKCWVPFATETNLKNGRRAFFVRDSFLGMPQTFFAESFKRAYFSWTPFYEFPAQAIAKEKPDVLVQEMIERHFHRPLPENPAELLPMPRPKSAVAKHRIRDNSKIAASAVQPIK